jgi:CBS domain-containing protein
MSPDPRTLTIEDTVGKAITIMQEFGFRNIPLVNSRGDCAGLVQIRNIIDFLAELYPEEVLNVPPPASRFSEPDGA